MRIDASKISVDHAAADWFPSAHPSIASPVRKDIEPRVTLCYARADGVKLLIVPLEPDARWANMIGGFTASGSILSMSIEVLQELSMDLASIVEEVPPFGGTELLDTARALLVQSWYRYEFLPVGCLTGFQAVEAAFRQILLPDAREGVPFRRLIKRATDEGLLTPAVAELLDAGAQLRNLLSHPGGQTTFTLGIADSMLRTSHLVVRDVCLPGCLPIGPATV
jgi:hypothetical protein